MDFLSRDLLTKCLPLIGRVPEYRDKEIKYLKIMQARMHSSVSSV